MLRELFASRVKEWRAARNLSQRAFGRRFTPPVSAPFICAMEKGDYNPTLEQVEKVARALNVDPKRLLR
jgi:transcriptional regulator with XRE-family HTH domain